MAVRLKLKLGRFAADCRRMVARLEKARSALPKEITKSLRNVGKEWEAGAKLRVPYETGELQESITHEVEELDEGLHMLAVGSNVEHAVYMELGTENWAGGAVKALGSDPQITDAQAIETWKALEEGGRKPAPEQEQGPWLRPAFWAMGDGPTDALASAVQTALK